MPWIGGAIAAGGSLLSGIMGSNAANKAAQEEVAQQQKALQFQQSVYGQTVQNLSPYVASGNTALQSVMGLLGLGGTGQNANAATAFKGFTGTPFYQFPLQQGNLALNRQLASAGLTGSGAALKDATAYNQGYASQGLGSYLQQLLGLTNTGESAAAMQGSQGNQASGLLASIFGNIGGAQAAGTVGSNNALSTGIQGATGSLLGNNNGTIGGQNSVIGQLFSQIGGLFSPQSGSAYAGAGGPGGGATNVQQQQGFQ
jgi:hypothetical protein